MDSSNLPINIVVWAENREAAAQLAAIVTNGTESNDTFNGTVNERNVVAYIRYPSGYLTASPQSFTDVLIVAVSGNESCYLESAYSYLNARKAIPFKFVVSSEDVSSWASKNEAEYISQADFSSEESRLKIVRSVTDLDQTLRKTFDSLDLNKNGFISAEELVKASSSLGHELNQDEAKNIANSLSTDGNISFTGFKSWWIRGKGDFNMFRRIVQMEIKLGGFIKQSSQIFNDYVEKINSQDNSEPSYVLKINIGPTEEFESGVGINWDLAGGKDFESVVSSLPDYFKSSPFTYALELHLNDEETGALVKQTLDTFKAMANMIPQAQQALDMGLQINIRHVGTSVFIDFSVEGLLADLATQQLGNFNLGQLNFSGASYGHACLGLKLNDLLSGTIEELLTKVLQFKVSGHSEFYNISNLVNAAHVLYQGLGDNLPRNVRKFIGLIKLLSAVKKFNYEFKYDLKELVSFVKDLTGEIPGAQNHGEGSNALMVSYGMQLGGLQEMGLQMLEGYKPMVDGLLEPYKPMLQAVNFDKITVVACMPQMKFYYKTSLNFVGLSAAINEKILN
jgi:hypothetical protein